MILGLSLLALQAPPAAAQDDSLCEAHVFPTDQVQGFTRLGNYGLLSDLTAGGAVPEEAMLAKIKADSQFAIASHLFGREGRLAGFRFVEHREPVDAKVSVKQKTRLTGSQQPCYVEIVVNYISFSDSALTKAKVGVHFVTRDFRDRPDKPAIRMLGGSALLAPYVSERTSPDAEPDVDFVGAYTEAFDAAITRFWQP